jgi:hypothetical protein
LIKSDYEYSYSELFTESWSTGGQMTCQTFYIEGLSNGSQNIKCEYILEDRTLYTETVKISVLDVFLYQIMTAMTVLMLMTFSGTQQTRFFVSGLTMTTMVLIMKIRMIRMMFLDGTADWEDETRFCKKFYKKYISVHRTDTTKGCNMQ